MVGGAARRHQPVDDQPLTGDVVLRLGNVAISLREVVTFLVVVHLGGLEAHCLTLRNIL